MKRTGRKHRRTPEKQPQSGTQPGAAPPSWQRPSERRFLIEMGVCFVVTAVFPYFLNNLTDVARRDCEARGGEFVVKRNDHRCVFPGEPAAP